MCFINVDAYTSESSPPHIIIIIMKPMISFWWGQSLAACRVPKHGSSTLLGTWPGPPLLSGEFENSIHYIICHSRVSSSPLSTFSGFEGDASSLPDAASYMEIEKSCQQNLTIFIFVFPNHPPESLAWVCSSSSEPDDTISAHEFAVRARSWWWAGSRIFFGCNKSGLGSLPKNIMCIYRCPDWWFAEVADLQVLRQYRQEKGRLQRFQGDLRLETTMEGKCLFDRILDIV